jgi:hypothetical protein
MTVALAFGGFHLRMKRVTFATAILALVTASGCDTAGDGIGPEGGQVASADGRLVLDVPEGALDVPVEITIEEADDLPPDALGPAYRVVPVGTVFNGPVHVLYNYGARGMEVDPHHVRLVVEREHEWSVLPDRHVYPETGLVSASTLYLSTFCVVERP